jgi:hypothetical protein
MDLRFISFVLIFIIELQIQPHSNINRLFTGRFI